MAPQRRQQPVGQVADDARPRADRLLGDTLLLGRVTHDPDIVLPGLVLLQGHANLGLSMARSCFGHRESKVNFPFRRNTVTQPRGRTVGPGGRKMPASLNGLLRLFLNWPVKPPTLD